MLKRIGGHIIIIPGQLKYWPTIPKLLKVMKYVFKKTQPHLVAWFRLLEIIIDMPGTVHRGVWVNYVILV